MTSFKRYTIYLYWAFRRLFGKFCRGPDKHRRTGLSSHHDLTTMLLKLALITATSTEESSTLAPFKDGASLSFRPFTIRSLPFLCQRLRSYKEV
ncbi:hypothetical protein K443DRAFT_683999 [Laccaria amethystina LaAM-08-1]|uniref:Uncharacterized protein n=1 Tax=Laccaria amethystina LaAM-08-1 TaxID=1095629 RepID=A0A0C9WRP9_9AGAR|nr:hypothetical protein K443DRAFT_683999 [Laccaria amethystina LaAM-08-1]